MKLITMKVLVFAFLISYGAFAKAPDLTKGEGIPAKGIKDWNLGPTGARGWIYSDKYSTSEARQIYITTVEKSSPAYRKLKVGDVIIGIGKEKFNDDPRRVLGRAIGAAEANKGTLSLLTWRDGKTLDVNLQLESLGQYAETAPFNCPKSAAIFKQACEVIADDLKKNIRRSNWIVRSSNALALLASKDKKYIFLVKKEVAEAAKYQGIHSNELYSWYYGPVCSLISEYTVATGDTRYLKDLKRIVMEIVDGQSPVGAWGHRFVDKNNRLRGYGMMNATSVPLTISLVLARKAGIEDSRVDIAIEKSCKLLRFYVGKGAIPYGDHHPWIQTHDDNGKNGMAAVLFNILKEEKAAEYYSHMSVAAHSDERETGHTGNFFNIQWAMPSVALSGPQASGAWMREYSWYYDLARRWDGSFVHQGAPKDKTDAFRNWDTTGVMALAYAQGLRNIYLTGKESETISPISSAQAQGIIALGRGWSPKQKNSFLKERSEKALIHALKSWSPTMRVRAAKELSKRNLKDLGSYFDLLKSKDVYTALGACELMIALRGKARSAVPQLTDLLDHHDLWLRIKSADALAAIGKPSIKAVPRMLEMFAETSPDDPRGMLQRYLCFALFDEGTGLLGKSLEGVNQSELLKAVQIGLKNDDGRAREKIATVYDNLEFEELRPILPAIIEAIETPAPSGIMFSDKIQTSGIKLLVKHKIDKGLTLSVKYIKGQKQHGSVKRIKEIITFVKAYGTHARAHIPALQKAIYYFENEEGHIRKGLRKQKAKDVRNLIEHIKRTDYTPRIKRI